MRGILIGSHSPPLWSHSPVLQSPLTPSLEMNLLKCAMYPVNLCTLWRLLGGFIIVIVDTFSGLGSIPHWEYIYLSSFLRVDQMYTSQGSTLC
jgi:hypothetical protein